MSDQTRFGWMHLAPVLLGFLGAGGLVLAFTRSWAYALGVGLGPFAGAVARDWQSCCAENSWAIMPYAVGGLAGGGILQFVVPPRGALPRAVRAIAWWLASLGWFLAALLSYAHALE